MFFPYDNQYLLNDFNTSIIKPYDNYFFANLMIFIGLYDYIALIVLKTIVYHYEENTRFKSIYLDNFGDIILKNIITDTKIPRETVYAILDNFYNNDLYVNALLYFLFRLQPDAVYGDYNTNFYNEYKIMENIYDKNVNGQPASHYFNFDERYPLTETFTYEDNKIKYCQPHIKFISWVYYIGLYDYFDIKMMKNTLNIMHQRKVLDNKLLIRLLLSDLDSCESDVSSDSDTNIINEKEKSAILNNIPVINESCNNNNLMNNEIDIVNTVNKYENDNEENEKEVDTESNVDESFDEDNIISSTYYGKNFIRDFIESLMNILQRVLYTPTRQPII